MKKKLHLQGWSKEEIERTNQILKKAERKKHPHVKSLEKSLYWFTLIVGILGTILLSFVLTPILIVNKNMWGYILTGMFGLLLGVMIVIIIKDLHWLEDHHHLFISLIIPIVAIFNLFIVVSRVNLLNYSIGLNNFHNPIVIGVIYFVCFIIPYTGFLIFKRK